MIKSLRRWVFAARMRMCRPFVDGYVVSYPKCGVTWLQTMLRKLLMLHYGLPEASFDNVFMSRLRWSSLRRVPAGVPVILPTHNMPNLHSETAEEMRLDNAWFAGKPVCLVVREPKDMEVSLYMHATKRASPAFFSGSLHEFCFDPVYGVEKYAGFLQSWDGVCESLSAFCVIRYEDMHADPAECLRRAASAFGLDALDDEHVAAAVEFGRFDNMRKIERTKESGLATLAPPENDAPDAYKVRKGAVGGHREYMDDALIARIDEALADRLPAWCGYEDASASSPE